MDANRLVWALFGLCLCWATMSFILSAWVHFLVSAAFGVVIVKWMRFRLYFLIFDTASGRVQALEGDKEELLSLKECIESAITQKDLV